MAYDAECRERPRTGTPPVLVSQLVADAMSDDSVTDVMLFSHGWMGDVPGARLQYTNWLSAMAANGDDIEAMRRARPGFRPLLVGLHWPSEPWGDESFAASPSFAARGVADDVATEQAVEDYLPRLSDTAAERQRVRRALQALMRAVAKAQSGTSGAPSQLPAELSDAYRALDQAVGLRSDGEAGDPGADREPFNADGVYAEVLTSRATAPDDAVDVESFGLGDWLPSRDTLLSPLRTLSFWKMKDRARQFGETAVNPLLVRLQKLAAGRRVRFHLMGHSFGCIVASAAVAGPPGSAALPQPVDSLSLLQGAMSLWSFCNSIPSAPGKPGYFSRIFSERRVRGPIVTSQSSFDGAVGRWYPLAARAGQQVAFAAGLPVYGGIGAFGIQGAGPTIASRNILPATSAYKLAGGGVCNVEASSIIREGGGFSGAHSDICHPEVAHLVWSAMIG
ncbi:MAG TPA: hypothetical protein VG269_11785 [Tepidisphaeraceae bacterium]|jgi:hypothetical protein|nr:hypothetical protein [Tepidisphaeraceae bacterium]